jgi:hypothetical protein
MHTRSAPDTCATGKPITRSAPHMRYGYFFTSSVLPAVHGICATGSHIRCATGKLFSSSEDVRPGKLQEKRKCADGQCWSQRSYLWDLLRYNLDVMHIEKKHM